MNTRRVPGVTRNSGWQAVDAEIVKGLALRQQQAETTPTPFAAQADHILRQAGEDRKA
ncbi:MAG: hypothetical protein AVDCRST_MAG61-1962 [uncultured Friedmanniella sp.]|uniref:Uncharacterized protein n=1 Tax=uncultured Friedmanniella sp. TaxID=335381 RepID=A0A6J4KTL3_9ACTN|nr:hypothetical protein [uncultured Friedmanniella sp.]CAA9314817.1 MAG: hypothetical protein AVDCRST_MAG61-1962 [uncultured Friedmanniella sp.]